MATIEVKCEPKWGEQPDILLDIEYKNRFPFITTKQLIDLHDATGKLLEQKFRSSKRNYDPEPEFGNKESED